MPHSYGRCEECVWYTAHRPSDPPGKPFCGGACLHPDGRELRADGVGGLRVIWLTPAVRNALFRCPTFRRRDGGEGAASLREQRVDVTVTEEPVHIQPYG